MSTKPRCIIVTGRPGSGKSTLSKKLGRQLWMPVVSRDEIKEGYVNTFGIKHEQLPANTNEVVSSFFFDIVCQYLASNISVVIEAAFQHKVWDSVMPNITSLSDPCFVLCCIDPEVAARRHLQRGLDDPNREFYHGDESVSDYRATGKRAPLSPYVAPNFSVPTIHVLTESDYTPSLAEVVQQIKERNGATHL